MEVMDKFVKYNENSHGNQALIHLSIIKDIRTRVLGESISRVREIWSVNNVICSVNRDSIVFHLD